MRYLFTVLLVVFPCICFAQYMGAMPHPVVMIAAFAREIAVCEAAHPVFRGETAQYLHEVDRIAPGYLNTVELDSYIAEMLQKGRQKVTAKVTESACNEQIFPVAKRALDALPCFRDKDWKECPKIN